MDAALIVTLVFSIISAVLVSIELLSTFFNHRKERTVQTVTEQRSHWIQEVRSLFSSIIDLVNQSIDSLITLERQMASPQHRQNDGTIFNINELRNKYVSLRLLLNFENKIDENLLDIFADLIQRIDLTIDYTHVMNFCDFNIEDFVACKELLSLYMSMYLKSEWERLKKESETGKADSKFFDAKYNELLIKYKSLIDDLSKKIKRVDLNELKEAIESDPQYKAKNIASYNCLNIIESKKQ